MKCCQISGLKLVERLMNSAQPMDPTTRADTTMSNSPTASN